MNIAVDGPAGAGKSSIAKLVAKKLGIIYVDTGAMYRTLALGCHKNDINVDDEASVSDAIRGFDIEIAYKDGVQNIFLNGENVSETIRQEEIGKKASSVARYSAVREKLVEMQRDMAKKQSVIMDGRDIGTVVLPDAELKIYLTASVEVRADRRFKELKEKNVPADLEEIKKDIEARDYQDMNREVSPLKKADDAVEVDTSDMTIDEVVDKICSLYEKN